ncbi:hypothetical protein LL912_13705 [Niabella sp. CC-SYL272]|uniref:hypothetical protein n=1 Tax=Niabella agricola TaxID=2891571 RepID=UPI001F27B039|nr:hypothetical protein [Niabella agricola]MCF3109830.1 hypothetical protein [Niabella agricola]
MGDIIFKAKNIVETAKDITWTAHDGDIQLSAKGLMRKNGETGEQLLRGAPPERAITTKKVKKINVNTPLTEGLDAGGGKCQGLQYGTAYEFEAAEFDGEVQPDDYANIKWGYKYQNEEGIADFDFNATGKKIRINISTLAVCGCDLTVYAYFSARTAEAKHTEWVHYRFRWFSIQEVTNEINNRVVSNNPKLGAILINQSNTPLCGMAIVFYLFAKTNPQAYSKASFDLHRKGEAEFGTFKLKPKDPVIYEMDPVAEKYPKLGGTPMPKIDWIDMVTLRNQENTFFNYTGEAGQEISGINYPDMVAPLFKNFLQFNDVKDSTHIGMNPTSTSKQYLLKEMDEQYKAGYNIAMLIDADMLKDSPSHFAPADNPFSWRFHWIIYEGNYSVNSQNNTCSFSFWCWGNPVKLLTIKQESFDTNIYGYIKAK